MLQALIQIDTLIQHWYYWSQWKKYLIALKAETDKLDINKLINVSTSFNDSKAKVDDLDVGKVKTVPAE